MSCSWCNPQVKVACRNGWHFDGRCLRHIDVTSESQCDEEKRHTAPFTVQTSKPRPTVVGEFHRGIWHITRRTFFNPTRRDRAILQNFGHTLKANECIATMLVMAAIMTVKKKRSIMILLQLKQCGLVGIHFVLIIGKRWNWTSTHCMQVRRSAGFYLNRQMHNKKIVAAAQRKSGVAMPRHSPGRRHEFVEIWLATAIRWLVGIKIDKLYSYEIEQLHTSWILHQSINIQPSTAISLQVGDSIDPFEFFEPTRYVRHADQGPSRVHLKVISQNHNLVLFNPSSYLIQWLGLSPPPSRMWTSCFRSKVICKELCIA